MLSSLLLACASPLLATTPLAASPTPSPEDVVPRDWLVIAPVDRRGRRPFRPDAVFAAHLLDPEAAPPSAGDPLVGELEEESRWEEARASEDGALEGRIGYAYTRIEVADRTHALAQLTGASTLYVDGRAYAGDLYRFGFGGVPLILEAGTHDVFVTGARGGFTLVFNAAEPGLRHGGWDDTLPQLVVGEAPRGAVGLELANLSDESTGPIRVRYGGPGLEQRELTFSAGLPPLGVSPFALPLSGGPVDGAAGEKLPLRVRVVAGNPPGPPLDLELALELRAPGDKVLRTYVSEVDDSVQRYAIVPPSEPEEGSAPPETMRLVLSLHGASVTAWRQAACYRQRPDFWLVAPENRRPFGFDWQDWGRRDAYDALALAREESGVDPRYTYVTGHSMGGHGTWSLAANDLDGFAVCAPSAGWESFDSYGGRPDGALRELWHAADATSETLALIDNLVQLPVFVLHGTNDRTVPASEALTMMEALSEAGGSFDAHFEGGAGHWWGDQCMDWPPIFEMFREHEIPENPGILEFTTVDPAVDAEHHWVRVEQPQRYGERLFVLGKHDEEESFVQLTTMNVGLLRVAHPVASVELDGQRLEVQAAKGGLWFARDGESWSQAVGGPAAGEKNSRRSGPLKRAFDQRFLMVVGTAGDEAEDQALAARAAFDAGLWRYRGNGRAEIWSDADFLAREAETAGRSVILYGNRDTNAAWDRVLDEACPIRVERGSVRLRWSDGDGGPAYETHEGDDLGCLFVHPRRGEERALVGVLADSGLRATRVASTLALFVSGVGYPDFVVFDSSVLARGDGGVLEAGWMDSGWELTRP